MNPFITTAIVAACAGLIAYFLTLRGRRRAQRERTYNRQQYMNNGDVRATMDKIRTLRNMPDGPEKERVAQALKHNRRNVGNYDEQSNRIGRRYDDDVTTPYNYGLIQPPLDFNHSVDDSHHHHSHDHGGGGSFDGGGSTDSWGDSGSSSDSSSFDSGSSFSSND